MRLLLTLAILAGATLAAPAQDITGTDRATIASCLRESLDRPRACIGAVAVVCARAETGDGSAQRRQDEIDCTRREAAIWRERLDLAAAALERRLEPEVRERFTALQKAWESFAAQKCAFIGEVRPFAAAPVVQAGCALTEMAERAIDVERLLRRLRAERE